MKKYLAQVLVASASYFSASSTLATVVYNDVATFNAQLGATVVNDYENPNYKWLSTNAEMNSVMPNSAKYTPTGFSPLENNHIYWSGGTNHEYCAGCNGTFLLDVSSTEVSGAHGVFGVGFDYSIYSFSDPFDTFVTYGDGSTDVFSISFNSSWDTGCCGIVYQGNAFWGITSDLGISSVHVGSSNGIGAAWSDRGISIDNLTLGNKKSSVAEPSNLLITLSGFMCLVFMRLFRSRS